MPACSGQPMQPCHSSVCNLQSVPSPSQSLDSISNFTASMPLPTTKEDVCLLSQGSSCSLHERFEVLQGGADSWAGCRVASSKVFVSNITPEWHPWSCRRIIGRCPALCKLLALCCVPQKEASFPSPSLCARWTSSLSLDLPQPLRCAVMPRSWQTFSPVAECSDGVMRPWDSKSLTQCCLVTVLGPAECWDQRFWSIVFV
jgi:hypothetical protein